MLMSLGYNHLALKIKCQDSTVMVLFCLRDYRIYNTPLDTFLVAYTQQVKHIPIHEFSLPANEHLYSLLANFLWL